MPTIRLAELQCIDTQDPQGPDEAALLIFRDGQYDGGRFRQLWAGETWIVDWEIEFEDELLVYLAELDGPATGDLIGFTRIETGAGGATDFGPVDAHYRLSWHGVGAAPVMPPELDLRRNEAGLSIDERNRFVAAYNACISNGTIGELVAIHANMTHRHHGTMSGPIAYRRFLPWHRRFLLRLQEALQNEDPGVIIPYWRWAANRRLPDWLGAIQQVVPMPGGGTLTIWDAPGPANQLPTDGVVEQVLRAPTYFSFAAALEGGPHNAVHGWVGGVMNSIPQAPAHPAFWMHHAECDRIWELWRAGPNNQDPGLAGLDNELDPFGVSADATLDTIALGYRYD